LDEEDGHLKRRERRESIFLMIIIKDENATVLPNALGSTVTFPKNRKI
jgi:hypothetical protein